MSLSRRSLVSVAAMFVLGCGTDGSGTRPLVVGREAEGGSPGTGGTTFTSDDAGLRKSLAAHIEQNNVTVTIVTLACAGDCADVVAIASGGTAPYKFKWEDDSTSASRHVCPTATTSYEVTVTDTGFSSVEFRQPPQMTTAPLTAAVLACPPDGGAVETDAGLGPTGPCDSVADGFLATGDGANPHGVWSYGWTAGLGGAFTLYSFYYPFTPVAQGAYAGPGYPDAAQWFDKSQGYIDISNGYSIPPLPEAEFNPTSAPSHPAEGNLAGDSYTLAPGQFALAPGASQYSIARWTAPSDGKFVVKATFQGLCGDNGLPITTADAHVLHNGIDLGSGGINASGAGNTFAFANKVTVAAGDTIDFSVGSSGGVFVCPDATALDAQVCTAISAP